MTRDVPSNQPRDRVLEAVDSRSFVTSPELTRLAAWPNNIEDERSRREVLNRYDRTGPSGYSLPRFSNGTGEAGRWQNLERGASLFAGCCCNVADSLPITRTICGGAPVWFADGSFSSGLEGAFRPISARRAAAWQEAERPEMRAVCGGDPVWLADGSFRSGVPGRTYAYGEPARSAVRAPAATNLQELGEMLASMQFVSRAPGADQSRAAGTTVDDLQNLLNNVRGRALDFTPPAGEPILLSLLTPRAPELRQPGGDAAARPADARPEAQALRNNEGIRTFTLNYPDGTARTFTTNNGELTEFREKRGNEEKVFKKDDAGQWYWVDARDQQHRENVVRGSFELTPGRDFVYNNGHGHFTTIKPDGTVLNERAVGSGGRVAVDETGRVPLRLTRADRSTVDVVLDSSRQPRQYVETDASGAHRVTWTRGDNNVWTSRSEKKEGNNWVAHNRPSAERRNLQLNINGRYSYEDSQGFQHAVTGGREQIEPRITRRADARDRDSWPAGAAERVEIQYPGGREFRTVYLDGQGNLVGFTEKGPRGEFTFSKRDRQWFLDTGLRQIPVTGDFSYDRRSGAFISVDNGFIDIKQADGTVVHGKKNANGSELLFNDNRQVSDLTRRDRSTVHVDYQNGQASRIVDTDRMGNGRTVYTRTADGWTAVKERKNERNEWVSDGRPPERFRSVDVNDNGMTVAVDARGLRHVTNGDGTRLNEGPGGSRFTFDDRGRITGIVYPAGANRSFSFSYHETAVNADGTPRIDRFEVRDGNGRVVETRTRVGESNSFRVTDANGRDKGVWQGDLRVTADGKFLQQDPLKHADGAWIVREPNGDRYLEKVNGDTVTRTYPDRSVVELRRTGEGELVTKITRGRESREFVYVNGRLDHCVDVTAAGRSEWRPQGDHVTVMRNGDVAWENSDRSVTIKKADFRTVELDADGDIRRVTMKNGSTRVFNYQTDQQGRKVKDADGFGQLISIVDTRHTQNGDRTETWTRQRGADGRLTERWTSPGPDGRERVRLNITALQDGDYKYKSQDGREHIVRAGRDSGEGGFSGSVDESRERLMEAVEGRMDASRRARMEAWMKQFEKRGQDRVNAMVAAGMDRERAQEEWEKKISQTYDHFAHMVAANLPGAAYDAETRLKIMENAMWVSMEPTGYNQVYGTCWISSGNNTIGWTNNPHMMARMLDQVVSTRTFTDVNGRTWNIPPSLLQLDRYARAWSPDKPNEVVWNGGWGKIARGPALQLCDAVAAHLSEDGRRMDGGASGGTPDACLHALQLITGDTAAIVSIQSNQITDWDIQKLLNSRYREEFLKKGGVILLGPGHMFCAKLVNVNGQWQIVTDNQWGPSNDQVIGRLTDLSSWNVQRTRERYQPENPGAPRVNDQPLNPNVNPSPNNPYRPSDDDDSPYSPGGGNPRPWRPVIPFRPRRFILRRIFGR